MTFQTFNGGFRKLIAWREAHELTVMIYKATVSFPKQEQYGMTSQLQRASSSVAAQVAEGSRMPTLKHRKIFYDRAYASAAEVDSFLELAKDLSLLSVETYQQLLHKINRVSYLVLQLSVSCKKKKIAPASPTLPSLPTLRTLPVHH